MTARSAAPATVAALALLQALLLTACGGSGTSPGPAPGTSGASGPSPATPVPTTPSPAPAPAPDDVPPDTVRTEGVAVDVGGTTVLHALAADPATALRLEPDGDVVVLTAEPAEAATSAVLLLAPPAGATLALQDDGSLAVLDSGGGFLAGAGRPTSGPGGGPPRVTATDAGTVRVTADAGAVTARVGRGALAGATWGEREGGRSLAVEPAPWARHAGVAGQLGTWSELVRAVPEADTPGMRDQLTCHALGAPDKAAWNLEPWRPDVGLLATLAAACNPT